ncbi:helix-turn-helix transcriptional regulator, partial [Acinetobacter baumannii]
MTPKNLLKVERNILPKIELVQLKIDSKILPTVEKKPILMEDAKYKDFADRLNALMKAKDSPIKTINELKNAIGVSYEMARRYTLGSAKPRIEKLQTLADIFGVEISYLDHGTKLDNNIDLSDKVGFEGR